MFKSIREMDEAYFSEVMSPRGAGKRLIVTGIPELDRNVIIERGNFVPIGGRRKAGKTALATINLAVANAARGVAVDVWSLEMGEMDIYRRWLSHVCGVDGNSIRRSTFTADELALLRQRRTDAPIFICTKKAVTLSQIMRESERRICDLGIGLVIIDFAQLINGLGGERRLNYSPNREQILSAIVYSLNELKDTGACIVVVGQLRREPPGSDSGVAYFRESEAFEQAADVAIKMVSDDKSVEEEGDIPGHFDVISRHGSGFHCHYVFERRFARFRVVPTCTCRR